MLHLWVIALFVAVAMRDSLERPLLSDLLTPSEAALVVGGAFVLIGALAHAVIIVCTRRVARRGSARAVLIAEGAAGAARWMAVGVHFAGVLALGWLDGVRGVLGDLVLLDELVVLSVPVLVFAWGWWALWPLEAMLRNAALVRKLDEGGDVYPMPGRGAYTVLSVRHHVVVWLAPLVLILAWSEGADRLTAWLGEWGERGGAGRWFAWLGDAEASALANAGLDLAGALVVFLVLGPVAMRFVWDTVRMPPGPLRERLEAMCRRYRVRVSEILVWRTYGTMINGAVLGFTPAFRYVLLTDALLDSLPDAQVEAVMAHEVAHVRHRHIVWLALVIGVVITAAGAAGEWTLRWFGLGVTSELPPAVALGVALGAFGAAMLVFGVVSRRFEWQADAFAAAHMSGSMAASGDAAARPQVTHEGAAAMGAALRSVAVLNHVPIERRSWRHGSIGTRLRRLESLVGVPASRLPADRVARRIKRAAAGAALVLLALVFLQLLSGG